MTDPRGAQAALAVLLAALLAGCSAGPPGVGPGADVVPPDSSSSQTSAPTSPSEGNVTNSDSATPGPSASSASGTTSPSGTSSGTTSESSSSTSSPSPTSETSTSSAPSSTSGSSSTTATSAPLHQVQITLVNDGYGPPDAFLCFFDGDNPCDPDQPLPGPGANTVYSFQVPAPDLLQVTAYYPATAPTRGYTFGSVGQSMSIEVRTSELAISASCTSGCTLS